MALGARRGAYSRGPHALNYNHMRRWLGIGAILWLVLVVSRVEAADVSTSKLVNDVSLTSQDAVSSVSSVDQLAAELPLPELGVRDPESASPDAPAAGDDRLNSLISSHALENSGATAAGEAEAPDQLSLLEVGDGRRARRTQQVAHQKKFIGGMLKKATSVLGKVAGAVAGALGGMLRSTNLVMTPSRKCVMCVYIVQMMDKKLRESPYSGWKGLPDTIPFITKDEQTTVPKPPVVIKKPGAEGSSRPALVPAPPTDPVAGSGVAEGSGNEPNLLAPLDPFASLTPGSGEAPPAAFLSLEEKETKQQQQQETPEHLTTAYYRTPPSAIHAPSDNSMPEFNPFPKDSSLLQTSSQQQFGPALGYVEPPLLPGAAMHSAAFASSPYASSAYASGAFGPSTPQQQQQQQQQHQRAPPPAVGYEFADGALSREELAAGQTAANPLSQLRFSSARARTATQTASHAASSTAHGARSGGAAAAPHIPSAYRGRPAVEEGADTSAPSASASAPLHAAQQQLLPGHSLEDDPAHEHHRRGLLSRHAGIRHIGLSALQSAQSFRERMLHQLDSDFNTPSEHNHDQDKSQNQNHNQGSAPPPHLQQGVEADSARFSEQSSEWSAKKSKPGQRKTTTSTSKSASSLEAMKDKMLKSLNLQDKQRRDALAEKAKKMYATAKDVAFQARERNAALMGTYVKPPRPGEYKIKGKLGSHEIDRSAYRILYLQQFTKLFHQVMGAFDDVCETTVPTDMQQNCRPMFAKAEEITDMMLHGYSSDEICLRIRQCLPGWFDV